MTDIPQIAARLTEAQRRAVVAFDGQWVAGPALPDDQLDAIGALREHDLLEREFVDEGPARQSIGNDALHIRLSACWHFRLTETGLSLAQYLRSQDNG